MEKKKMGELTPGEKVQWEGRTWTVIGHINGKTALLDEGRVFELSKREIKRLEALWDE